MSDFTTKRLQTLDARDKVIALGDILKMKDTATLLHKNN